MRILLHICCAPCSIYPFKDLSHGRKNSITGFFYNPNIHPFVEMDKRRQAVHDYVKKENFDVVYDKYDIENFFYNVGRDITMPFRCHRCWAMRLKRTAAYAKQEGFEAFATTLLVSPYQDRMSILKIGSDIAADSGVKFIDEDWRKGFIEAQQCAKAENIYKQKYCGCLFSEKEKYHREKKRCH